MIVSKQLCEFYIFPDAHGGVDQEGGGERGHAGDSVVDLRIDLIQKSFGDIGSGKCSGIK